MEVKIGVQQTQRELVVEVDEPADQIEKRVQDALTGEAGVLSLTDIKGRKVLIAGAKLAYVEIGTGVSGMVGFRS